MRAFIFSLCLVASIPGHAASPAPSPRAFQSIELRGGGTVNVRFGATRSVTVRTADPGRPVRVEGERLVIDRCAVTAGAATESRSISSPRKSAGWRSATAVSFGLSASSPLPGRCSRTRRQRPGEESRRQAGSARRR